MKKDNATFGAGCFWGVEEKFSHVEGVISTEVGYEGGEYENPTYGEVCALDTGHTEVIHIVFDPEVVSYEELLQFFWQVHNPTSKQKTQYKSVIFFHNKAQKRIAEISMEEFSGNFPHKIVTEILPAKKFYRAEEYHQQYLKKHR